MAVYSVSNTIIVAVLFLCLTAPGSLAVETITTGGGIYVALIWAVATDIEKLMALHGAVKGQSSLPIDFDTATCFVASFLIPILPIALNLIIR